ncbi:hypothetical protein GT354_09880, partial [Streptomyces sp. SID3343]|nr:hypothetical protein [Streptomyces sp. SID3343]
MTTHASAVPATPLFVIEYPEDGAATVDGTPVYVPEGTRARHAAIDEVRFTASLLDRPVRAIDVDPDGTRYPLLVDPDGTLTFLAEPHPDPDEEAPENEAPAPSFGEDTTPTDDHDAAFDRWWADSDGDSADRSAAHEYDHPHDTAGHSDDRSAAHEYDPHRHFDDRPVADEYDAHRSVGGHGTNTYDPPGAQDLPGAAPPP